MQRSKLPYLFLGIAAVLAASALVMLISRLRKEPVEPPPIEEPSVVEPQTPEEIKELAAMDGTNYMDGAKATYRKK